MDVPDTGLPDWITATMQPKRCFLTRVLTFPPIRLLTLIETTVLQDSFLPHCPSEDLPQLRRQKKRTFRPGTTRLLKTSNVHRKIHAQHARQECTCDRCFAASALILAALAPPRVIATVATACAPKVWNALCVLPMTTRQLRVAMEPVLQERTIAGFRIPVR
jgi:hypothetical protein